MGHGERLPAKSNPDRALPLYCLGRNSAAEGKNRALFTNFSDPPPRGRALSFSPRPWSPRHVSGRCPVGAFMARRLPGRAFGCLPRVSLESRLSGSFASALSPREVSLGLRAAPGLVPRGSPCPRGAPRRLAAACGRSAAALARSPGRRFEISAARGFEAGSKSALRALKPLKSLCWEVTLAGKQQRLP